MPKPNMAKTQQQSVAISLQMKAKGFLVFYFL